MTIMRVAGVDPSFTHFAASKFDLDIDTLELTPLNIMTWVTTPQVTKSVRRNSDDLRRATEIRDGIMAWLQDCELAFTEVPTGAQSARAALSNGVVLGLLAGFTTPIIQVMPSETKILGVGIKNAAKKEVIDAMVAAYPTLPWTRRMLKGVKVLTDNNEHMADACAVVRAGVQTAEFVRTITMLRAMGRTPVLASH